MTFMRITRTYIPLPPPAIRRIVDAWSRTIRTVYGGWWDSVVRGDAKERVRGRRSGICVDGSEG